ncbi:hypothetical protein DERF_001944 [Dermatophagoides farinae]|uniref:Uncharacterized protein n=2 Tax=Dermatophagoides farinae TaxID=6954 RepID=A0A922I9M1_DERFA|nr:hypothetical protein DERF_001944 [Dermatophagoides farinae]
MTLEDEQRLSTSHSSTSSNTINVDNVNNTADHPEESDQSNSEQSTSTPQDHIESTIAEEVRSNNQAELPSDQQDDSNIDQLQHYINQIRFDSTTGSHQIPPELLAEDQDLLESEFEKLDNDMDVIEMYRLIDRLQNDTRLKTLLTKPQIQMFIKQILNDEHEFLHQQLAKSHRANHNRSSSTLFEDQRLEQQISPLEHHLIDSHGSDEQNFLRLLIEIIQQQPY